MVTASSTWLSFSLTPCQGFIAAARTVRDLKVGSALLSHLVRVAILAGINGSPRGQLLYPVVNGTILSGPAEDLHLPNRFLMAFESDKAAKAAAKACKKAVADQWSEIASGVRTLLAQEWDSRCANWSTGWDEQIGTFWEMQTVVLSPGDCTPGLAQNLVGRDRGDWGRQWDIVSALVGMGKQVRHFRGDQGIGRPKCSMMGELEQMGPGGEIGEQANFWTEVGSKFRAQGIRINESDRLCAVSLTKRFAPVVCDGLKGLRYRTDDTAWIATAKWRDQVERELPTPWKTWSDAANALIECLGKGAETPGRYLVAQYPDAHSVIRETSLNVGDGDNARKWAKAMLEARKNLQDAARKQGIGSPPRYLAALALDGDKIGKWLSGEEVSADRLGPNRLASISHQLRGYAARIPRLVNEHHGFLIYAGGDDVLALLPVATALGCAQALRTEFSMLGKDTGKPATASIGIAIFHFTHDLRDALRRTRARVEEAKELGRDALGWEVVRRSGNASDGLLSWEGLDCVLELAKTFEGGASDRWVYRLAEATASVDEAVDRRSLESLIKCYVGCAQRDGGATQVAEKALRMWQAVSAFAEARATPERRMNTVSSLREAFINSVGLCSFVARRGREDA